MITKSFHALEPGDCVRAHGTTMRVISRRNGRPGNSPNLPTRTIVEWVEVYPHGDEPETFRGPWSAGLTTGTPRELIYLGQAFHGIRRTWIGDKPADYRVTLYSPFWTDEGPEFLNSEVETFATYEEAQDWIEKNR